MSETILPEFDKRAFNCPICGAFSDQKWLLADSYDKYSAEFGGRTTMMGKIDGFAFCKCSHCNKLSVWDKNKKIMVFPKSSNRTFDLTDVPNEIAEDYEEACLVLSDSPKASAALSRRCLQNILRNQGYTDKSLFKEIQLAIDSSKLPSHISESLDAVRNIGNFAAHPLKDISTGEILPVEAGEAEWNLETLEALFDFYYVQPAKTQRRKDALNEKLKSVGKPEI